MSLDFLDQPVAARAAESPDPEKLRSYLSGKLMRSDEELKIEQFPGGYSNLTFQITAGGREMVLRKPPVGANIKSAHDMEREFKVLSALKPVFGRVPEPLLYCAEPEVMGSPFYIMERVKGVILRNRLPRGLEIKSPQMRSLSLAAVDCLADLHSIDVHSTGLIVLGKPEGFVQRQVDGWTKRYFNAETEPIRDMNEIAEWLGGNMPADHPPAFIHNDFKYDNVVLHPDDISNIMAILDWEMATVGDPLMDLGTTLAYWAEKNDSEVLKQFNLTWMDGNLDREGVLMRYAERSGKDPGNFVFYYVFGLFKIAVIAQQIYARFKKGFTEDPRFSSLIYVVKACAGNAANAIRYNRISNFY